MSDRNSAYAEQYYGEPSADNAHGIEALRQTESRALRAFLEAGGKLTDWLNAPVAVSAPRSIL